MGIRIVWLISVAVFAVAESAAEKTRTEPALPPPNLIFFFADDFRQDNVGFSGSAMVKTPNLDRLAREGVWFNKAYVTTSICAVSRASVLTGMYQSRHQAGFFTNFQEEHWAVSYPMELREAGYRTGFIGKYGVNVWVSDKNYPVEDFDFWWSPENRRSFFDAGEVKDVHTTRYMGMKAVEFLNRYKDEPFCLSISFLAVHGSLEESDPAYDDMFEDETVPFPPNYGDVYYERLPAVYHERAIFGRVNFERRFQEFEEIQKFHRERKRKIYGLDMAVGRILHELEALGLEDETIVIFHGDNGYMMGEHGMNGKWMGYEESIRVPMIVYDPFLPDDLRGRRLDAIVLNIDVAPTLLDYAGLTPDPLVQGRSLKPRVRGEPGMDWRDDFFYEQRVDLRWTDDKASRGIIPPVEGVVGERYKYMIYYDTGGDEELYDTAADPYEMHNLADDPSRIRVLEMMRARHRELKEAVK